MKSSSCKAKGRRLQQKVAQSIRDAFTELTPDDVRSTSMGAGGEDVQMSTRARMCVPLSVECKCVEKLNVWQCLEQAERNCPSGATPCLVFSRNRSGTYAVLPWEELLALYVQIDKGNTPPRLRALLAEVARWHAEEET
mgnify:CR=1 FL=1